MRVGDWYTIGLALGVGAGIGVLAAALLGSLARGLAVAALAAAAIGGGVGFLVENWDEAVAGGAGGIVGSLGAVPVVAGALRRGGTRGGTALLVGVAGVALGALSLIPVAGYLVAVAVPALGARLRSRGGERYAGLRILARD